MSELLDVCEQAARLGGAILRQWEGKFSFKEKGPADLVTEADVASQEVIRDWVLKRFPDHDFLGEEPIDEAVAKDKPKAAYRWIVDPLDGTMNYVHGLPGYAVSVGLEHHGKLVAGCIFDPLADECFTAEAGRGAFLNNHPIQTSTAARLSEAMIAVSFRAQTTADSPEIGCFLETIQVAQSVRRMGSAAINLAYIACGRMDGYWAINTSPWDVAAGLIILSEAGGCYSEWDGKPTLSCPARIVAASTRALHDELRAVIKVPPAEYVFARG